MLYEVITMIALGADIIEAGHNPQGRTASELSDGHLTRLQRLLEVGSADIV